jgi:NADH:ubiquinone oxidoreductase subunit 5 (subunit L)/multisubunit Na+/H+ antiporter MnhA subunit
MSPGFLVLLPVCALLVGLLLELVLARVLSSRGKGWLALASSVVALGGVLALWPATLRGGGLDVHLLTWDGPAALAYHVDGLSLLFALMASGIGAAVLLYSIAYMAEDSGASRFYALMLVFIAGLIHLVYSADLLLLYLSWEVIGLCSFLLVGFWYQQREAAAGARKVLVMTHIAGYGLLAAVLILYARTGSTLWTDPQVAVAFGTGLFLLTLLAAVAKSVQFPLHTWIPDAMAAPTPVSALLHAACYVKAGVYLIARLHSLGPWPVAWQTLVVWIGTITLLVGGLYAMVQSDLKRLLAFSTVSQIGYMVLGLGLSTPLGIAAGLLHCLNHGLFKGGLFLCAGAVQRATGTKDMDRLGGLARRMPTTTALWLVVAGSVAGVPLLSGFVSKWLLYNAALEAGQVVPALISWVVSIVTIFYFLKATSGVFLGDESADATQGHEAPRVMLVAAAILAAASLVLGVAPQLAVRYVINPLLPALGATPVIGVSWLGLTAGGGSWFATGGLILALVAVGLGLLVYWLAQPLRGLAVAGATSSTTAGGIFTGGEPLTGSARLPASDFSLIIRQSLAPFYRWADVDRYYLALWRGLLRLSDGLGRVSTWLERRAIPAILVLSAGLLIAALVGVGVSAAGGPMAHAIHAVGWPLLVGTGLALLALLLTAISTPGARRALPLLIGAGLLSLLGLGIGQPIARLILLEGAAFVALALVWQTATARPIPHVYLLAVLLSAAAMVSGTLLLDIAPPGLAIALLLTGFTLKLALVPLYLWLPLVAEATPASVVGLIVAVVDVAAFGELLTLRGAVPWLFAPPGPWLALALLSALGGALLMLAQRDLKRLLAFSTIEDMGYLLLGVTLGGELGLGGAMLGATVHALAKALLFASLSAAEAEGPPTLDARGLAVRYPISGAGFLLGALAMLGLPPTLGYVARWRLYGVAAQAGLPFLVGLLLATSLAMLAYARVIARCWWGPGEDTEPRRREPIPLTVALVGLSLILLLAGLWPSLVSGTQLF